MNERVGSSPDNDKDSQSSNSWIFVSLADFSAIEPETPIANSHIINCRVLSKAYSDAVANTKSVDDEQAVRVYKLLTALCDLHFKPQDRAEPYGPIMNWSGGRTLIPSDLPPEQNMVLAELAPNIDNPGLRARLADIAWHNDRKLAGCARIAIDAYVECVRRVLNRSAIPDEDKDDGLRDPRLTDMLYRACAIARRTGWNKTENEALKTTVRDVREWAAGGRSFRLCEIARLDLEQGITPAAELARQIEQIAACLPPDGDPYAGKELWGLAAEAFHEAHDEEGRSRCRREVADGFVRAAERPGLAAMLAVGWYEEAIEALHGLSNVKDRRQALQQRMVERQRDIHEEMGTVTHSVDLTDFAISAHKKLTGFQLSEALKRFALLAKSPEPQELERNALDLAIKHPLQSVFATRVLDHEGKVRSKTEATDFYTGSDPNKLRHQIAKHEELRRLTVAFGLIEPARQVFHTEHRLDTHDFLPLVMLSPFVPHGHGTIFATGFARFFAGDFLTAAHLLIPQVENALRHVLRQVGHDVTNMRTDGTQENLTLSVLLDPSKRLRRELETVFGPAIVREIDDLFNFHGGPALRHDLAHGLMSDGAFWSADVIYACWFMFRLVVLSLQSHWQEVEQAYSQCQCVNPSLIEISPQR